MAGLFQVLWGQEDGEFQTAEPLVDAEGKPLEIPPGKDAEDSGSVSLDAICTRPTAVDWDGDGDLDLVVGNFGGTFFVFEGEGGGVFLPTPEQIVVGNEPLKILGHHSDPFIVDWDLDGDLDVVSGSSQGGVQWAENEAGAGEPARLTQFKGLVPAANQIEFGQLINASDLQGPTTSTRVWVDDVNSDGKWDLIVGDSVTLTSPVPGMTVEAYEEKLEEWQKKLSAASRRMSTAMTISDESLEEENDETADMAADDAAGESGVSSVVSGWISSLFGDGSSKSSLSVQEKAQQEISDLYQQRSEFMDSESTGFVWIYLQQ